MEIHDNPATRQAGLIRPLTAGAESTPFSSRDLYGTDDDRLQTIAYTLKTLSLEYGFSDDPRDQRVASELEASARHYERLAKQTRDGATEQLPCRDCGHAKSEHIYGFVQIGPICGFYRNPKKGGRA